MWKQVLNEAILVVLCLFWKWYVYLKTNTLNMILNMKTGSIMLCRCNCILILIYCIKSPKIHWSSIIKHFFYIYWVTYVYVTESRQRGLSVREFLKSHWYILATTWTKLQGKGKMCDGEPLEMWKEHLDCPFVLTWTGQLWREKQSGPYLILRWPLFFLSW